MELIAVIASKGGSGKTTLAEIVAAAAAAAGVSTLLVDMDVKQQTAVSWGRRRNQPGGPKTEAPLAAQAANRDNISAVLEAAKGRGVELVVIDTPPASDFESELAARAARLVLIACRPSIADIETLGETYSLRGIGSKPAFVVLNATPTAGTAVAEATSLIKRLGYKVAPVVIPHRVIYMQALALGRTGAEGKGKASKDAAEDAAALWAFVQKQLTKAPEAAPLKVKGGPP